MNGKKKKNQTKNSNFQSIENISLSLKIKVILNQKNLREGKKIFLSLYSSSEKNNLSISIKSKLYSQLLFISYFVNTYPEM